MIPRKEKNRKSGPRFTEKAAENADARRKRLAEALKENLKKRKVQARGREDGGDGAA